MILQTIFILQKHEFHPLKNVAFIVCGMNRKLVYGLISISLVFWLTGLSKDQIVSINMERKAHVTCQATYT